MIFDAARAAHLEATIFILCVYIYMCVNLVFLIIFLAWKTIYKILSIQDDSVI